MSAENTYKRDKAVIKALMSAPGNKIGIWYAVIGSAMSLVLVISELANGKDNLTPMSFMLLGFLNMLGIILALNGSTVFTGEKNSAQAREMTKGAYNQLPTFLCMPIKKESLYRWQFERIMIFVIIPSIYAMAIAIYSIVSGRGISVDIMGSFITVFAVTLSCFLITYGTAFRSKKTKMFLNVFYIASIVIMSIGNIIFVFAGIFIEELGYTDTFITANVEGGEIIMIASGLLFPMIVYLMYKNIVLKRIGGSWYE